MAFKFVLAVQSLPIVSSSSRFPVNRIYCVGRNYRDHAVEMGGDPDREPPFFFCKPSDAIVSTSSSQNVLVPYPPMTQSLHFEGELVVAIGKDGIRIPEQNALGHVFGYALGCDLTRRDLQARAKELRRPWDASKGFDHSAPCGPILPKELFSKPTSTTANTLLSTQQRLQLHVNGQLKQQAPLDAMIWSVPEIVSHLSQFFRLQPGDLIMTGTPSGVGSINVGDTVSITCGDDIPPCEFTIGPPEES
eukprot:scaffold2983_cov53-Attheya_sp.AAC.7